VVVLLLPLLPRPLETLLKLLLRPLETPLKLLLRPLETPLKLLPRLQETLPRLRTVLQLLARARERTKPSVAQFFLRCRPPPYSFSQCVGLDPPMIAHTESSPS
jgi:hypothetical protein